jgi:hypothetical protein
MIERQPYDEKRDRRADLDRAFLVHEWRNPFSEPLPTVVEGPSWWRGEEDASQQFMASMGVMLDG